MDARLKETAKVEVDAAPEAAAVPDDDEFDDGAGPDWAADEMRHEDGNDGLDMEDEDLFEDDEDDGLGDDDEIAFNERQQARETMAAMGRPQRRVHGDDEPPEGAADENDDEGAGGAGGGAAGASSSSEWYKATKADLKAER